MKCLHKKNVSSVIKISFEKNKTFAMTDVSSVMNDVSSVKKKVSSVIKDET